MIFVFNKNKILSYLVASFIVLFLFTVGAATVPNDAKLLKVSANSVDNNVVNSINNIQE